MAKRKNKKAPKTTNPRKTAKQLKAERVLADRTLVLSWGREHIERALDFILPEEMLETEDGKGQPNPDFIPWIDEHALEIIEASDEHNERVRKQDSFSASIAGLTWDGARGQVFAARVQREHSKVGPKLANGEKGPRIKTYPRVGAVNVILAMDPDEKGRLCARTVVLGADVDTDGENVKGTGERWALALFRVDECGTDVPDMGTSIAFTMDVTGTSGDEDVKVALACSERVGALLDSDDQEEQEETAEEREDAAEQQRLDDRRKERAKNKKARAKRMESGSRRPLRRFEAFPAPDVNGDLLPGTDEG